MVGIIKNKKRKQRKNTSRIELKNKTIKQLKEMKKKLNNPQAKRVVERKIQVKKKQAS